MDTLFAFGFPIASAGIGGLVLILFMLWYSNRPDSK